MQLWTLVTLTLNLLHCTLLYYSRHIPHSDTLAGWWLWTKCCHRGVG